MSAAVWRTPSSVEWAGPHGSRAVAQRFMSTALAIAACTHLAAIGGLRLYALIAGSDMGSSRGHVEIISIPAPSTVPPPVARAISRPAPTPVPSVPVRGLPTPVADLSPAANDLAVSVPGIADDPRAAGLGSADASDSIVIPGDAEARHPLPTEFVFVTANPEMVRMPAVTYPEIAREAGLEGVVVIEALLSKDGHVLAAHATHPVGLLTESALEAVRASAWKPAMDNQRPVEVWVRVPVRFSLGD